MQYSRNFQFVVSVLGFVAVSSTGQAITIEVDGTNHTKLSTAVAAAYLSDIDGPDIINLNVNSLPDADLQILLDKPIVINGDGNTDNISCDLVVNMAGIKAETVAVGDAGKSYIEISAVGDVQLSELQIHPNGDGANSTTAGDLVTGIRMNKPASGVGNYTLTDVQVSGSTGGGAFMPLDSGDDLYGTAGSKWGGHSGGEANHLNYGVFQLNNAGGTGVYNATLDHCHAGLGYGSALNILPTGAGIVTVNGGVYGHVGRDGIHIDGSNVTVKGTHDDRLRIVRSTNIPMGNAHGLEVVAAGATVPLIEYVDAVGVNTANNFALRGGTIALIQYCRGFGKMVAGRNETVFFSGSTVTEISNCTFHGNGSEVGTTNGLNPLSVTLGVTNPVNIKDSIFTSHQNGFINVAPTTASLIVTFTNCALPTDGFTEESLSAWPFGPSVGGATVVAPVSVSPDYRLTLVDYDWSDNQGHNKPDNARGNLNVLRPTSTAYSGKSSTLGQLNGGAGAPAAGIEQSVWMLM